MPWRARSLSAQRRRGTRASSPRSSRSRSASRAARHHELAQHLPPVWAHDTHTHVAAVAHAAVACPLSLNAAQAGHTRIRPRSSCCASHASPSHSASAVASRLLRSTALPAEGSDSSSRHPSSVVSVCFSFSIGVRTRADRRRTTGPGSLLSSVGPGDVAAVPTHDRFRGCQAATVGRSWPDPDRRGPRRTDWAPEPGTSSCPSVWHKTQPPLSRLLAPFAHTEFSSH